MKIAIIPARGGSKRIPRKNIRDFHGKPILAYSIETALHSKLFDKVIVSTDDSEIMKIAIEFGAECPFTRSGENSNDFATTSDVLLEVLNFYDQQNLKITTACCIYPTAPLIESNDLKEAYGKFEEGKFQTLISCVEFDFPIQRSFKIKEDHAIALNEPQHIHSRSQDLVSNFHDAGAFYFFDARSFQENKSLWNGNIGAYTLLESKVQDIDTEEDWKMAELKYTLRK